MFFISFCTLSVMIEELTAFYNYSIIILSPLGQNSLNHFVWWSIKLDNSTSPIELIEIDVPNRKLNLMITSDELEERLSTHKNGAPEFKRGYKWLHAQHILQADKGCDFDFLRAESLQNG